MRLEVFDRDQAAATVQVPVPLVRVDVPGGRLLLNVPVWQFLEEQYGAGQVRAVEVVLMFDAETRTAAIRALADQEWTTVAAGARWPTVVMRGFEWPRSVRAREFTGHYRVAGGVYPARLVRGPGPRLVTFEVGTAQEPTWEASE